MSVLPPYQRVHSRMHVGLEVFTKHLQWEYPTSAFVVTLFLLKATDS
jgi:hypothetical protein